jgi:hypothetical protein
MASHWLVPRGQAQPKARWANASALAVAAATYLSILIAVIPAVAAVAAIARATATCTINVPSQVGKYQEVHGASHLSSDTCKLALLLALSVGQLQRYYHSDLQLFG